jgi:hypothetical protein
MRLKTGLIIFLFSGFICFSQKKTIILKITYTEPYCGGVRPSKEMEAESKKAKPYVNKTIVIVSQTGKTDSVRTNSAGALKLKLKPGTYSLFEAWRYYKRTANGMPMADFEPECLRNEWQKEMTHITVSSKTQTCIPKNDIVIYCPWAVPCMLESSKPPMPQ